MIALLDTHVFLWAATAPGKLSAGVRREIADPANEVYVSTVTFWEIALKFALGKLTLAGGVPDDLVVAARRMRLDFAAPTAEESAGFHRLPRAAHRDPFDRMLIWQCLRRDWTLVTKDRELGAYRSLGLKTYW